MSAGDGEKYDGPVTVIGLFPVAAGRQDELVDAINATAEIMRARPGFLGSAVYAGLDGTRVINYSRWDSVTSLEAAQRDPVGIEHARRMFEIAKPDPTVCVLRAEHFPSA
ncbi:antibiotic biosynthesis monooxygenase [Amycolatopsis sp. GM8]|uniref:antibiotic biosynthesis monooxygenase family protein n=1 Tax=Amycolatopsis sp. GM8 TaxID=2896530 RepID=UPI001F1B74F3|nr:antibiotic biosynthesis monooxygenase family protein [Amycolatopsis sp. GM8]